MNKTIFNGSVPAEEFAGLFHWIGPKFYFPPLVEKSNLHVSNLITTFLIVAEIHQVRFLELRLDSFLFIPWVFPVWNDLREFSNWSHQFWDLQLIL